MVRRPPRSALLPDTALYRSGERFAHGRLFSGAITSAPRQRLATSARLSRSMRPKLSSTEEHTSPLPPHLKVTYRLRLVKGPPMTLGNTVACDALMRELHRDD